MRTRMNSTDRRLRDLERRAATGDPSARGNWFRALRQAGGTQFVDQVTRELEAKFRSNLREERDESRFEWCSRAQPEESPGFGLVCPGDSGATIRAPDQFGRPQGLIFTIEIVNTRMSWSMHSIHTSARGEDKPLSHRVEFKVALSQGAPLFPPLHPFHFWLYNRRSYDVRRDFPLEIFPGPKGALPARFGEYSALVSELDQATLAAGVREALDTLDMPLNMVGRELGEAMRRMGGTLSHEAAVAAANAIPSVAEVLNMLQAVPGPVIDPSAMWGTQHGTQAWNVSGDGVSHAAMGALAKHLVRFERAVPTEGVGVGPWLRGDPFDRESGYFSTASLTLTSARAKRTRHPLVVNVRWDRLNGAWRDRGDGWIGNSLPPQGQWKILANGPSTVEALAGPAIAWIKTHFPHSTIEVAYDRFAEIWNDEHFRRVYPT